MQDAYAAYVMADPIFYDAMHSEGTAGASFAVAGWELPEGWTRSEQDDWFVFDPGPREERLPSQGWKIHASAATTNADRVLEAVWSYCVPRGIPFKFLRSPNALLARVSKYAPRGYSGKLVTIYPSGPASCKQILTELGALLDGEPNPYILSDLRWGSGPLHVRYGAYAMRYDVDKRGEMIPVIEDDKGRLVPDRRDPVFRVPEWVTLPDFLAPHLAARNAVTVGDLPYSIDKVLHFSNGGGVYAGTDRRTGKAVVLKEGRPHAGLDAWGHDAVRRVEHEYEMLRRLTGVPGVPEVHDLFWVGEHRFMAMDHVDGDVLSKAIVTRYPLIDPTARPEAYAKFTDWAVSVYEQVERSVLAMHERGVVYGDLHLFNVMVGEDGKAALLDFEVATDVGSGARAGLGNQGFAAPRSMNGPDVDLYSLACLRLALFLPMTELLWLHRPKARHFVDIITEHFPVPEGFLEPALEWIAPISADRGKAANPPSTRFEPSPRSWLTLRDDLVRSILASATPERDDRMFPGDIKQFAVGGLGLAYGTAGVLYALSVTGAGRHEAGEEWLRRRALSPDPGTPLGLYDGLHGVAYVLEHLGHRQDALDIADIFLHEDWERLGSDLTGGLAGAGLNLLHLATAADEPGLREAGLRAAELVAARLSDEDDDSEISGGGRPYAGLMRGGAGKALLLLRAYETTGDEGYLEQAAVALRQDLRRCVVRDNGTIEVNEGWRTMPYLEVGSIGIGMVLEQYLAHRPDERFAEVSGQVLRTARSPMYILPGLFSGRAGILYYLASRSAAPATDPLVTRQVRNLAWHALPYGNGIAFPGTALMRLSMDLATGTAGVLLALGAALHDEPVHLPLLTAAAAAARTPAPIGAGTENR